MPALIECVPNISEGRDPAIVDEIVQAARSAGAAIIDIYLGAGTNRSVITMAGDPDAIFESAFRLIQRAAQLIVMRVHRGTHPRMGATDVCPFIPLRDAKMEQCIDIAKRLGKRVADELKIPVYLYEDAASTAERRALPYVRKGGYEALEARANNLKLQPDYGSLLPVGRAGATAIGARPFLVAYNVNLATASVETARTIADRLRKQGAGAKSAPGEPAKAASAPASRGKFSRMRTIGWYIEEFGRAQVSTNILDFEQAPIHAVYEEVDRLARELGTKAEGSEIVGLVPIDAVLASGRALARSAGLHAEKLSEEELVELAIKGLGLSQIHYFAPREKILEYRLRDLGV
jgi:glutamate formiminotransferase/formiminotetrahydrofolate cyclodeaminase